MKIIKLIMKIMLKTKKQKIDLKKIQNKKIILKNIF